jgi:putative colanic acid biosynthesis UDP-glucose lipid carrier transferase
MSPTAIRPTRMLLPVVLRVVDSILLCATLPLVQWLTSQPQNSLTTIACLVSCIALFVVGEACGIYRPSRGRSADSEVVICTLAWSLTCIMLLLVGVFTKQIDSFARSSMVLWYVICGLLLISSHMTVRAVLESMGKRGVGMKRTAIIGANRLGYDIAKNR